MRKNRQKSISGNYHVVIRGVDKMNIFFQDSDRIYFLHLLKRFSKKYNIKIICYTLMDNHVHLLFSDQNDYISNFMQVLCSVYARYFNRKYDRIGHLFQDRFASEVIETTKYLLTAFRYILQNPFFANNQSFTDYKWSSYYCYCKKKTFIYTKLIIDCFASITELYNFLREKTPFIKKCIDIELRQSERELYIAAKLPLLSKNKIYYIKPDTDKADLFTLIKNLLSEGISISSISRLTGISKYLIKKATNENIFQY